jgi:hypothetical protein
VTEIVDPAKRLDPSLDLRRLPVAAATASADSSTNTAMPREPSLRTPPASFGVNQAELVDEACQLSDARLLAVYQNRLPEPTPPPPPKVAIVVRFPPGARESRGHGACLSLP